MEKVNVTQKLNNILVTKARRKGKLIYSTLLHHIKTLNNDK